MKKLICWWLGHDYTCKVLENIPATPKELENGVEGFRHYARMWCKRCGDFYKA